MDFLNEKQAKQQKYFNRLEVCFGVALGLSGLAYVFTGKQVMMYYFFLPMGALLNLALIGSILWMRCYTSRHAKLFPNEKGIWMHMFIFLTTTTTLVVKTIYFNVMMSAKDAYTSDSTPENEYNKYASKINFDIAEIT